MHAREIVEAVRHAKRIRSILTKKALQEYHLDRADIEAERPKNEKRASLEYGAASGQTAYNHGREDGSNMDFKAVRKPKLGR